MAKPKVYIRCCLAREGKEAEKAGKQNVWAAGRQAVRTMLGSGDSRTRDVQQLFSLWLQFCTFRQSVLLTCAVQE